MARTRTSSDLELLVALDRASVTPLHHQLEQAIREAVRDRRLPPSTELPSTRALAAQLRVSRGIVVEAYEQLVAEGYLAATPGGATRVSRTAAPPPDVRADLEAEPIAVDFRPGRPDVSEFPRAVWLRSLRRVLAEAPSERLTYLGGWAVPELRVALATYLNRARGTCADPAEVVVCSGFAQGLGAVRAHAPRPWRAHGRRRGPVGPRVPRDPARRRPRADRDPARRGRAPGRPPRGDGRPGRHRHGRAPVPDRGRPAARPARRARRLGPAPRRLDHRGRLRRRVPLRPRADRRDPGAGRRPRRLRGFGQQGPGAGPSARLAARAAGADRRARRGEAGRRHGLGRPRPARVRRRPRARRARPSPAPDAPDLSPTAGRPAGRAGPPPARRASGRRGRRAPRAGVAARRRRRGGRRRGRGGRGHRRGRPGRPAHRTGTSRPDLRLRRDHGGGDRAWRGPARGDHRVGAPASVAASASIRARSGSGSGPGRFEAGSVSERVGGGTGTGCSIGGSSGGR